MKAVPLRVRLGSLALALLLPGIVASLGLLFLLDRASNDLRQRAQLDASQAQSMALDSALRQRLAIAQQLAQSPMLADAPALSPDQGRGFAAEARAAMTGLQGWVELAAPAGTLLSTRAAQGEPTIQVGSDRQPLIEQATVAGVDGETGSTPGLAARVPVRRDGRTVLTLSVILLPSELRGTDDQQAAAGSADWGGLSADDSGWAPATAASATAAAGAQAPWALQGGPVEPVRQTLLLVLASLALAVGVAVWLLRSIARPVDRLRHAAANFRAGHPVDDGSTGITECDDGVSALSDAAERVRHAETALEQQAADAGLRMQHIMQATAQSQRYGVLGRVAASVAHDFNNLLGVISNNAHLIELQAASPALKARAAATLRAVTVGAQLTRHLLRLTGRQAVRPVTVDLADHLPEIRSLLQTVLGGRITLGINVDGGTAPVSVDLASLDLALVNLALNAAEAMAGAGHVAITAGMAQAEHTVRFGPARPAGQVLITFSDDGAGLDEALAEQVFEPFFKASDDAPGAGLGLAQLRSFCAQAGGHVWLTSVPGQGTKVRLLLPAAGLHDGPALADAKPAGRLDGVRVLLVEDDEAMAASTMALLRSQGCEPVLANSGAKALALIDGGARVNVVLADLLSAGAFDGVALATAVQARDPGVRVLLRGRPTGSMAATSAYVLLRQPHTAAALFSALQDAVQGAGN